MKKPIIIISGPTAVGKTDLSIKLAEYLETEIISADSMQVYKDMNIGTAKIMPDEMRGIKHHLIDIISPFDEWNVMKFKEYALNAAEEIYKKDRIPVVAGGTGFYIQALLKNVTFEDEPNNEIRTELSCLAAEKGAEYLHGILQECDPESAEAIHANNIKRVIRAIEFYRLNGYPISKHNKEQEENESPFNYLYIVLTDEREKLYERINDRVDLMIAAGLVDEVVKLRDMGLNRDYVSMQGIGYKEILSYLDGEIGPEEAVDLIKKDSRHFAKRQLTWFRREKDVIMINKSDFKCKEELEKFTYNMVEDKFGRKEEH